MLENRIEEDDYESLWRAPMQGVYIFQKEQEIKETLEGWIAEQCFAVGVDPDALYQTAKLNAQLQSEIEELRHLLALRSTGSEWISVKDRLPDGECFAGNFKRGSYGYGEIIVGYISGGEGCFVAENEGEILCGVTHWMPLPEPPEVEE